MISKRACFAAMLFSAATMLFAQEEGAPRGHRLLFGARVQDFPLPLFDTKVVQASTASPVADYTYTGTSRSSRTGLGVTVEYRVFGRVFLGSEFFYHKASYKEVTEIRQGKRDPNASTDDRQVDTITQATDLEYWEAPLLLRSSLRRTGILSHTYLTGGLGYRRVGKVKTTNDYAYADGTTDHNTVAAKPSRRNQLGAVAGFGMRFVDDFGINVMPEVRFTRWQGNSFVGQSYRSSANALRAGLGFSF